MDERVRIYELARKMNLQNQDIITTLRELGYDIKSHSSTVDAHAVGQLIAAFNKKKQAKQKEEKTKAPKAAVATATKAVAPAKVPPPPAAPLVKPRVLSRYRPVPAQVPGQEGPDGLPVPPVLEQIPVTTPPQPPPPPEPVKETPIVPAAAQVAQVQEPVKQPVKDVVAKEKEVQPEAAPAQTPPAAKEIQPAIADPVIEDFSPKEEEPVQDTTEDNPLEKGKAVKPMAPSVPIRIAAPSIRATPPRPPKPHRQTPSERHSQKKEEKSRPTAVAVEVPKIVTITQNLTVKELAQKMGVPETDVIKRLMMKGAMRTINQMVEMEIARELAVEMEYEVLTEEFIEAPPEEERLEDMSDEDRALMVLRPPVVTIMGHVDHGKTSLLDAIRQTKFLLTDSEAGGITQHIGAYHVEVPHEDGSLRQIVFLDTPGHEAFTAMRARGAKVTDIAILVVAADDGVMPQTIEAIDHAKAAGVPIIVAVNKIDKAGAEPDRVLTQLMEHELLPDKFGGETVTVNVSAKKRQGLDELLEMILLVADMQNLRANPSKPASGVIIEAELSSNRGAVATALVENGTLREGDLIIAGNKSGKVKALFDDRGQRVKAAGPSMPVEVLGFDGAPQAGDRFEVLDDIQQLRVLMEQRRELAGDRRQSHVTLESLHDLLEAGEVKELNVIIKADVQGTAEAISESVRKLTGAEVAVRVLRTASGDISENDVNLAASSNAIIVGFNVQPGPNVAKAAETAGVDVRTYNVIYQITDDLINAVQGLIAPIREEIQVGTAEVRKLFKSKTMMVAGCMVTSGKILRGQIVKVDRGGQIVHEGKLDTLKRFKDDAREVVQGFECGLSIDRFTDFQEGDKVHCYIIQETKREIVR